MDAESFALVLQAAAAWITFLGLVGLTGAVVCGPLACEPVAAGHGHNVERRLTRVAIGSAACLLAGAAARLYAQTWSVFGFDEVVTFDLVRVVGLESRWGASWRPQAGVALLALAATAAWPRWPNAGWTTAALAAAGGWVTLPMTGHAMSFASYGPWVTQVAHGMAAGLWIGTLWAVVCVIPAVADGGDGHQRVAILIRRFSRLAIGTVAAVGVTGVLTAVFHLEAIDQLWTTDYGQVLLLKSGFFLLTAVVGFWNWRSMTPRLGDSLGTAALRRTAGGEVVLATVVLLITAVLIHLAMPYVPM